MGIRNRDGEAMIWGETGSRHGATRLQLASVGWLWSRYEIEQLHDGDCVGVDAQLFDLGMLFCVERFVIHPPTNPKNRAYRGLRSLAEKAVSCIRREKPYFVRDRDVVDESEVIVACPNNTLDESDWANAKGGTWYTINYTLSKNKPLAVVWPHSGHITYKNWDLVKL